MSGKDRKSNFSEKSKKGKKTQTTLLITCDGETEVFYFEEGFTDAAHNNNIDITVKKGKGQRNKHVVESIKKSDSFAEIWCVFDHDRNTHEESKLFDEAFRIMEKEDANVYAAYSNDAFELWLCLHFTDITTNKHRKELNRILSGYLGGYEKGKSGVFDKIKNDRRASEQEAIKRAKKLDEKYKQEHPTPPYSKRNPCTTVYKLVERLRGNGSGK